MTTVINISTINTRYLIIEHTGPITIKGADEWSPADGTALAGASFDDIPEPAEVRWRGMFDPREGVSRDDLTHDPDWRM